MIADRAKSMKKVKPCDELGIEFGCYRLNSVPISVESNLSTSEVTFFNSGERS